MPVRAARMSVGSAATRAAFAAALLPPAIASSTWRNDVRMRERRALFTSVRRAILRVAFLADLVLAIDPSLGFASVIARGAALSPAQKSGGEIAAGMAPLIAGSRRGVNARTATRQEDYTQPNRALPAACRGRTVYATRFART